MNANNRAAGKKMADNLPSVITHVMMLNYATAYTLTLPFITISSIYLPEYHIPTIRTNVTHFVSHNLLNKEISH